MPDSSIFLLDDDEDENDDDDDDDEPICCVLISKGIHTCHLAEARALADPSAHFMQTRNGA